MNIYYFEHTAANTFIYLSVNSIVMIVYCPKQRIRPLLIITAMLTIMSVSCTTTGQTTKYDKAVELPRINPGLINILMIANVTSEFDSKVVPSKAKVKIAGNDSVSMNFSFFGMTVAKIFATRTYFLFYNIFENTAMEGTPNSAGLKEAIKIDLSFDDMVKLLKCQPPGPERLYTIVSDEDIEEGQGLYVNKIGDNYVEYILYSYSENAIVQYQRKSMQGEIILNVYYKDYIKIGGFALAQKIVFQFRLIDAEQKYEINSIEVIKKFDKPFSFNTPSSVRKYRFN